MPSLALSPSFSLTPFTPPLFHRHQRTPKFSKFDPQLAQKPPHNAYCILLSTSTPIFLRKLLQYTTQALYLFCHTHANHMKWTLFGL